MAKTTAPLLPSTAELLVAFGERLRLARRRRRLPAKQVAERAGMAPMTLRSLERGRPGVTVGAYLAVMQVLGIEKDLDLLAQADTVGRQLQDARLPIRSRKNLGSNRSPAGDPTQRTQPIPTDDPARQLRRLTDVHQGKAPQRSTEHTQDWIGKGGFASSEALSALIKSAPDSKKRR